MHPLLAHPRSLLAYAIFWAALGVLPWTLLHSGTPFGAALLSVIVNAGFAILSLPAWYLCRAFPLSSLRVPQFLVTQSVAALLWSLAWRALIELVASLLSFFPSWLALVQEVDAASAALLALGALYYLLAVAFYYVLSSQLARTEALERSHELTLTAQRAELAALRSQVHPHFLFNSLNTVNALIGYSPEKAREACILLAEYLRGTLRSQQMPLVRLADEWALCTRYLKVESLRLGERLQLDINIETEAANCLVPSLLLQPLVENAITHGVSICETPAPLRFTAVLSGERLQLVLLNSVAPAPRRSRGGVGLSNVRARLAAEYGKDATLWVESQTDAFSVSLELPAVLLQATPPAEPGLASETNPQAAPKPQPAAELR